MIRFENDGRQIAKIQQIGIALAIIFLIISAIMVAVHHGGAQVLLAPDTKVLTFAHWQLEDGFREGFEDAIRRYETLQTRKGRKVKIKQVAIPVRGYSQWLLTQLIGGEPADVIEIVGSSDVQNQYFTALSPYIGLPNPYNKGTPLEGLAWRETFVDDMIGALDPAYSEFFGVCLFMHTTRIYVNMRLYEKATGKTELPKNVSDWIVCCKQLQEYGHKSGRPIIPIGVRGFDKGTLGQLLETYNSQMNSDFSDFCSRHGYGIRTGEVFEKINNGTLAKERILRPFGLVAELGRYFADGFTSIDLEQTKYLFFSGNVGFFVDGTWNAFSIVQNSPFPVKIMKIPILDQFHPLGKGSFGAISELGSGVGGKFGIPKKTKHFKLALDFLQFITSWKINQLTMKDYCKWMSSLKGVQYEGLMKEFSPIVNTQYAPSAIPLSTGGYARLKMLQNTEHAILNQVGDPQQFIWREFLDDRPMLLREILEADYGVRRNLWNMDALRSNLAVGAFLAEQNSNEANLLMRRNNINLEGMVGRWKTLDNNALLLKELPKLKAEGN